MIKTMCILFILCSAGCDGKLVKKKNLDKQETKISEKSPEINPLALPNELQEISGISFINDSVLVCVEDENGELYFYNTLQQKVTGKKSFGDENDYEDVAVVGNSVYVVNSSGNLFYIKDHRKPKLETVIIKTPLKEKNNIEGLAYDEANNRLLLAVKDKGVNTKSGDKYIYAFDLATGKLNTRPIYTIRLQEIEQYYKGDAMEEASKKFLKALGNQNMNHVFRSSAISIHPQNRNIFVLSSINNMIVVLNQQGKLIKIIELRGNEFTQPEGLAFTSQGQLFISNEAKGKGSRASIIQTTYD